MQEYVRAMLALAAVSLLAGLLFPDGEKKNKRAFELALSIIALAILARPLSAVVDLSFSLEAPAGGDVSDIIADAEEQTMEAVAAAVGEGIAADIVSRFSLPPGSVRAAVTLEVEAGQMRVCTLSLWLGKEAVYADHIAIRDYARKTYVQSCEVKTDG